MDIIRNFKLGKYAICDFIIIFTIAYILYLVILNKIFSRKQVFFISIPFYVLITLILRIQSQLTDDILNSIILKISVSILLYKGLFT